MLEQIKAQRFRALEFKHILPLREKLESLNKIPQNELKEVRLILGDFVKLEIPHLSAESFSLVCEVARALIPWRKGPFKINSLEINSEWNSYIKYNLLESHLEIENKIIGDIGCNNGYYMFKMLEKNPAKILGFDPMPLCYLQFLFLDFFIKDKRIIFELLGIEELSFFQNYFDVLLCLGILYHRKSPLDSIKLIYNGLKKGGFAIFDCLIIDGDTETALCPKERYAKMPNVYFIPTLTTFKNWLYANGFKDIVHITTLKTAFSEQRKTAWSSGESLENFLDSSGEKTIEGYPAPKRAYLKAYKI
ncbi:MAG: tRNA 5-methoxyuridine(34)/uridine 5-oxyacetic acid(34) synthase CmoB [Helicobacteraceae bacterium]|nr:tRNA 5-methoxyuridine(34)/uridine 5-oxyacetic acid(34) synthase CmoB [Helicobacteraceae bacterium]